MAFTTKSGVLVLDADELNAKTLSQKLNSHGINSKYVLSPTEALELCRNEPYGVLLSEVWLPGKTGFEIAQELREEKISTPEIILMSNDSKISLFECHQAGACYFLRKPINFDELGLALKRFGHIDQMTSESPVDSNSALSRLYGQIRVSRQKTEVPVEVSNLGRGGFFAKTSRAEAHGLAVGQVIDFNLKLNMVPDCECKGRGIIRWNYQTMIGDHSGVGIEFLKVPDWFHHLAFAFADLFKVKEFIPNG